MIEILATVLGFVLAYMVIIFAIAWGLKRIDVVDIAWGGAFVVAAAVSLATGGAPGALQLLVTGLVIIWAIRLSGAILVRFLRSGREDPRYTEMRRAWKSHEALNAFVRIFLVQGLLATIVSLSVIVINTGEVTSLGVFSFVGAAIWLAGFIFEAVGDAQLKKHLANPKNKGKLMTSGLWRYTRHPNYFGEATQWWGIFVIALGVPYGWITIIAPVAITYLLLCVSGVPLTEKRFEGKLGWKEYKARTSVFLPLPPYK